MSDFGFFSHSKFSTHGKKTAIIFRASLFHARTLRVNASLTRILQNSIFQTLFKCKGNGPDKNLTKDGFVCQILTQALVFPALFGSPIILTDKVQDKD